MKRILVFGAGEAGRALIKELAGLVEVVAVIDNDAAKYGREIEGVGIVGPDAIRHLGYDCIVIASMYELEIIDQLIDMGIRPSQVCADIKERLKVKTLRDIGEYYKISLLSLIDGLEGRNDGRDLDGYLLNSRDCKNNYALHYMDSNQRIDALPSQSRLLKELYINNKITFQETDDTETSKRFASLFHQVTTPNLVSFPPGDLLLPEFLEQAEMLLEENPDVGVILSNKAYVDGYGRYLGVYRSNSPNKAACIMQGDDFINEHIASSVPLLFDNLTAVFNVARLKELVDDELLATSMDSVALAWAVGIKCGAIYLDTLGSISKKTTIVPDNNGEISDEKLIADSHDNTAAYFEKFDFLETESKDKVCALLNRGAG